MTSPSTDLGTLTRSRPRRHSRGHVRNPSDRTSQPFMGTITRPTTPPISHPPLLVGHPFTTPPVQLLISRDARRGRSLRTSADPGQNTPRSRVHPRPTHPLASTLQLYYPSRMWYKARDDLWWLGKVANRASTDNSSVKSYIVRFLDDPGAIKIDLLLSSYTTSRSAVHGSWCLHRHQAGGLARGVLQNDDGPRGAPLSPLSVSGNWRQRWFRCFMFFSCFCFLHELWHLPGGVQFRCFLQWFMEPLGLLQLCRFPYQVCPFTSLCFYVPPHFGTPFLVLLYPRPCVPGTEIQSQADILHCTVFFLSSDVTFSGAPFLVFCVPYQYFLLSTLLTVSPRIKPQHRLFSLNYQVWVCL